MNDKWDEFLRAHGIANEKFYHRPEACAMDHEEGLPTFTAFDGVFLQGLGISL